MILASAMLAIFTFGQTAAADIAAAEQVRLEKCLERVETAPEEAYEDGLAWLTEGNRPKARHCTALALIALDFPEEGAARLEALANAPDAGSLEQRAIYLMQSGNAWLLAGAYEAAITTLTNAIKLRPNDADLHMDRAIARMGLLRWDAAREDLDETLAIRPDDAEAYRLRAKAHLEAGNLLEAERDVNSALAAEPDNIDTLVLRGQVREAVRLNTARKPF